MLRLFGYVYSLPSVVISLPYLPSLGLFCQVKFQVGSLLVLGEVQVDLKRRFISLISGPNHQILIVDLDGSSRLGQINSVPNTSWKQKGRLSLHFIFYFFNDTLLNCGCCESTNILFLQKVLFRKKVVKTNKNFILIKIKVI